MVKTGPCPAGFCGVSVGGRRAEIKKKKTTDTYEAPLYLRGQGGLPGGGNFWLGS